MILLDAAAVVAFLRGERAADKVEAILLSEDAAITSVNLAETFDVLTRVFGFDLDAVEARLVPLLATSLGLVPIGEAEARKGGAIRAAHYHRRLAPVSLADCLLIASAALLAAHIATSDEHLVEVAQREGIEVERLPADAP